MSICKWTHLEAVLDKKIYICKIIKISMFDIQYCHSCLRRHDDNVTYIVQIGKMILNRLALLIKEKQHHTLYINSSFIRP